MHLGVIINDKLLWDDHKKTTRIRISKGLGILAKLRHCLPSHILLNLYYTLVHPYLDDCNIIWATGTSTSLNNLFRLQKKAMLIITTSSWRARTAPYLTLPYLTLPYHSGQAFYCLALRPPAGPMRIPVLTLRL